MSEWIRCCGEEFRAGPWRELEDLARERLMVLGNDVVRFGRAQNLVSRQDPIGEVARLIEESVRAGALLRLGPGDRLLDVGSGAGFPGVVLAVLLPEVETVLVERRAGRCDFIERCLRRLDLGAAEVVNDDVRSLDAGLFDVVSGKAVAIAEEFAAWVEPQLTSAGHILLFQRAGWAAPSGWVVDESVRVLESSSREDRWAFLLRRDE